MAAPTPTPRTDPTAIAVIPLRDGFAAKITLALAPAIAFFEKEVTPPGWEGGEKISQTTMFNSAYETFAPQSLKTLSDGGGKCAYDPVVLTAIEAAINRPDTITWTFRDGSTWCQYGYLKDFKPDALVKGQQPEATVTIVATNWDPVNHVEAGPVLTNVAGT